MIPLLEISLVGNGRTQTTLFEGMRNVTEQRLGMLLADALRTVCQFRGCDPEAVLAYLTDEVEHPTTPIFHTDPQTGKTALTVVEDKEPNED